MKIQNRLTSHGKHQRERTFREVRLTKIGLEQKFECMKEIWTIISLTFSVVRMSPSTCVMLTVTATLHIYWEEIHISFLKNTENFISFISIDVFSGNTTQRYAFCCILVPIILFCYIFPYYCQGWMGNV